MGNYRIAYFRELKKLIDSSGLFPAGRDLKILDVGCANGDWLELWKEYGSLYGSEVSPAHSDILRGKGIALTKNGNGEGGYHVVSMLDFLEHMIDPHEYLLKIKNSMAPGGVLIISVPDFGKFSARLFGNHYYLVTPMHFSYFNRKSAGALLKRVFGDTEVKIIESPPHRADVNALINWLKLPDIFPKFIRDAALPVGYSASLIALVKKV